jgi:hypothetical protein
MSVPSVPSDPATLVAIVLIVGLCVMYWRITVRLLATALIVLVVYGMIAGLHI